MLAWPYAIFLSVLLQLTIPEVFLSICPLTTILGQYSTAWLAECYALITTPLDPFSLVFLEKTKLHILFSWDKIQFPVFCLAAVAKFCEKYFCNFIQTREYVVSGKQITACPRNLAHFYIVNILRKLDKTSWTYRKRLTGFDPQYKSRCDVKR